MIVPSDDEVLIHPKRFRFLKRVSILMILITLFSFSPRQVQANEITILDGREVIQISTTADTVEELIGDEINIGSFDEVSHDLESPIEDGMIIEINRAFPIRFNDSGSVNFRIMTTDELFSFESSLDDNQEIEMVAEFNDDIQWKITEDNIYNILKSDNLDIIVTITTFDERVEHEYWNGEIETKIVETNDLMVGQTVVHDVGVAPEMRTTTVYNYVNSELDSIEESTELISEGSPKVYHVGIRTYIERFVANVTAYYADCLGCSGITASGFDVRNTIWYNDSEFGTVRVVAFDRRMPIGSIIHLEGIGNAIVLDRGGAVHGVVVDLLVNSGAVQFGRQNIQAEVLRSGW